MDSLQHVPNGRWKFDEAVGECFDDMVKRSIPLYAQTLDLIGRLAARHTDAAGEITVVDIGCSNGQALASVLDTLRSQRNVTTIKAMGIDDQEHMLKRAKARLPESVDLVQHDLRNGLPLAAGGIERKIGRGASKPEVMLMLWTSTFIPLEYRAQLFRDARAMIGPRGALFVADKLRGQTAAFQTALASEYANWKHSMGYSPSMIDAKARALEGVLVPMNAPEQKALISNEGWNVEEVTRYLGFASWYCLPR